MHEAEHRFARVMQRLLMQALHVSLPLAHSLSSAHAWLQRKPGLMQRLLSWLHSEHPSLPPAQSLLSLQLRLQRQPGVTHCPTRH